MLYDIHPDFLKYGKLKAPFNSVLLMAANSVTRFAVSIWPVPKGLTEIQYKINGYMNGKINVSVISPDNASTMPALVYFHGGGFALPSAPHHKRLAFEYALKTPCKVIFVDYRLLPKSVFPVGLEDCYAAYLWTRKNAKLLRIDKNKIAVGGDSAGGALAAGVSLLARDRGVPLPFFQMLIYPVTDARQNTPSMKEFTRTPLWDSKLNARMWKMYLKNISPDERGYASPMEASSLENMPPAYVEVAEFDCLRDEGIEFARALKSGGARVWMYKIKRAVHGYEIARKNPIVLRSVARRVAWLRRRFKESQKA